MAQREQPDGGLTLGQFALLALYAALMPVRLLNAHAAGAAGGTYQALRFE